MYNSEYGIFNKVLEFFGVDAVNWLFDPFWAMFAAISTNVWIGYPFMMVSLLAGLKAIPPNLYEASMIDGASKVRQFLPLLYLCLSRLLSLLPCLVLFGHSTCSQLYI